MWEECGKTDGKHVGKPWGESGKSETCGKHKGHTRTIWGRMWEDIGQYGKKLENMGNIWENMWENR
jgi:hypothetical protein